MGNNRRLIIPPGRDFVLASQSPRRRQLLEQTGSTFIVDAPDESVEQGCCTDRSPAVLVVELALAKATAIASRHESAIVLGADTVGELDGRVLGKPESEDHARQMLRWLSGREHRVLTGLALIDTTTSNRVLHLEQTRLKMDVLTDDQIEAYLTTDLWIGKAAAFGYQDGPPWLHVIEGLESNVVGLPVEKIPELIEQLNPVS